MATKTIHGDRKDAIRQAVVEVARRREKITYGELGRRLDIPARGPWKAVLDEIGREEVAGGRPDLTYLVVRSGTGYPGQIDFVAVEKPTQRQKERADAVMREVWAFYRGTV